MSFLERFFLGDDEKTATNTAYMGIEEDSAVLFPVPNLSPVADSIVHRCSRILMLSIDQLHQSFEAEVPEHWRQPKDYARNLVEYCSYKALRIEAKRLDHLNDKEFSLLTFDMMLAWEAPDTDTESLLKIDGKKTVGLEAFARIAPACAAVADPITVHNLFDALTSCSGGRLTLTSHALYFEASGIASYDKAVKYDLSKDLRQVVKRELTGPWGARLFDKAVMYKSDSVAEPIFLEFSQFSGHSHRDYWFSIIQEVLNAHKFIRKYKLKRFQKEEALSKAILGIFRYRAVKNPFHSTLSHFKSILAFNLAEKLPKGDKILEALYSHLELMQMEFQNHAGLLAISEEMPLVGPLPDSLYALTRMGFSLLRKEDNPANDILVGNVHVGKTCPLQTAVRESFCYSNSVEAARATFYQVKVEDINTNLAVIKVVYIYAEYEIFDDFWGWIWYTMPCIFFSLALCMFWHKHHNIGKPAEVFRVSPPPSRSAVELLSMLQDGVSQLQTNVQTGTIALLKLRALLLAFPQDLDFKTTPHVAASLVIVAVAFSMAPFRYLLALVLLEVYTRRMPLRKPSSEKLERRVKEWWSRIPAAPIQIANPEYNNSR
ncbi:hypothetical protein ZIOFF_068428 [Zingiber officinale]|uniref:DUF639 domain-containing protein n=1 Tax=Zingiber officinale TaxID=94328 RepID=A0A8J5CEQ8_ZINOF|nr:hypothetical protein ZIOFF_068428 [Zingiber officinale]